MDTIWNKCAVLSLSKVAVSPRRPQAELFCHRFITYTQKHLWTLRHEQDCHIHIENMNYGAKLWQEALSVTVNMCGINRHPVPARVQVCFQRTFKKGLLLWFRASAAIIRHSWDNFQCFHLHHWAGNSRARWAWCITWGRMLSMGVKSSLCI